MGIKSSLAILMCNQMWFRQELVEQGHRVVTVGQHGRGFDVSLRWPGISFSEVQEQLPRGFVPDRIVYWDDSGPLWLTGLADASVPSMFYSVDCHHHHTWHRFAGLQFDKVYLAQRDYLDLYRAYLPNAEWLPLWAPELPPETDGVRDIDVSFCGVIDPIINPTRVEFFDELKKIIDINFHRGYWWKAYLRSKIVINHAVKGDFNFRVFEALVCGSLLVTPEVGNGLTDLFTPGVDIITYELGSPEDAAEKIRYYLAHDSERERIAAAGRSRLMAEHTSSARAKRIENDLLELRCGPRTSNHYGAAMTYVSSALLFWAQPGQYQLGNKFLKLGCDELVESVRAKEPVLELAVSLSIYIQSILEKHKMGDLWPELVDRLHEADPTSVIFKVLHEDKGVRLF